MYANMQIYAKIYYKTKKKTPLDAGLKGSSGRNDN